MKLNLSNVLSAFGIFILFTILICQTADPLYSFSQQKSTQTQMTEPPFLVKEIASVNASSSPNMVTSLNGNIYFYARGEEEIGIWEKIAGPSSSNFIAPFGNIESDFFTMGNYFYFIAKGVDSPDNDLWRSNGTLAGTTLVKDTDGTTEEGFPNNNYQFEVVGNTLFFVAADGSNGFELWKSDGTPAGTVQVKDIYSGSNDSDILDLTAVNNTLYFTARSSNSGRELWKSDGTQIGTEMVAQIYNSNFAPDSHYLTAFNGEVYFQGEDDNDDIELWKSDGTEIGTEQVIDLWGGSSTPEELIIIDNTLYFTAISLIGRELWRSDGTELGTTLVKDIIPNFDSSTPKYLTPFGNKLIFTAVDESGNRGLWQSDGTEMGTTKISDINPTGNGFEADRNPQFTEINDTFYFEAFTIENGYELWQSDGTVAGTSIIEDFLPGPDNSSPKSLTAINSTLYFNIISPIYGRELWQINNDSLQLVTDINQNRSIGAFGGYDFGPTALGDMLYFTANDQIHGQEIWRTDGTTVGTEFALDINPGPNGSSIVKMFATDDKLFVSAQNHETSTLNDYKIWILQNDSTAPTWLDNNFNVQNATKLGTDLVFSSRIQFSDDGLWRSNGTNGGTIQLTTIPSNELITFGNKVIFNGDSNNGKELWISDGTPSGTVELVDIFPGIEDSNPRDFTLYEGKVYFNAADDQTGTELWVTDGTANGTQRVINLSSSGDTNFTYFGATAIGLFFLADRNNNGTELFITDGSNSGTEQLTTFDGNPARLKAATDGVFFTADDGIHGSEVWFSDGTVLGTQMIKDINPTGNAITSYQTHHTIAENTYIISLDDGENGVEYWRSDGTEEGTTIIGDINPNGDSAIAFTLGIGYINGIALFSANDGVNGGELWGLELSKRQFIIDPTAASEQTIEMGLTVDSITIPVNSLPSTASQIQFKTSLDVSNEERPFQYAGITFNLELIDGSGDKIESPTFNPPLTAVINYDQSQLPSTIDEAFLLVHTFDKSTQTWVALKTVSRDVEANQITVKIEHFSDFAIGGSPQIFLPVIIK